MKIHLVRLMEDSILPTESPLPIWINLVDLANVNGSFTKDPDEADRIVFIDPHQAHNIDVQMTIAQHRLYKNHSNKILVWNEKDRPLFDVRGLYVNVPSNLKNDVTVKPIPYLFVPADSLFNGTNFSTRQRTIRCTYRGKNTHKCRTVLSHLQLPDCSIVDSTLSNSVPKHEFLAELDRSVYALCPRGHGLTSFRLYEAMARGCLPVIIADGWLPPRGIAWQSFCIFVDEKDTQRFANRLDFTAEEITHMQRNLVTVYNTHLAPSVRMNYFLTQISDIPYGDCLSISNVAKYYNLERKIRQKVMGMKALITK